MKRQSVLVLVVIIGVFASAAHGELVTVKWDVTITYKYDFAARVYDSSFQPFTASGSHTFENSIEKIRDYGTDTITFFGGTYGTVRDSPITQFVEDDPYGAGLWNGTSYAYAVTHDFTSQFIEVAGAQANTYSRSPDGTKVWNHHLEITADRRSTSRGGLGTEDYSFNPDSHIAFYESFINSGETAHFNESFELFDMTSETNFGGYHWGGYAIITGIEVIPVPLCCYPRRSRLDIFRLDTQKKKDDVDFLLGLGAVILRWKR